MELVSTELANAEMVSYPRVSLAREWGAWLAMGGIAVFVVGMLAIGQGGSLRLAFPALSVVVGFYLYWKHPVHYITFTMWVWFTSPFIRRVVDYQGGWVDPSPVLLAPVLVSFIAGLGFLRWALPSLRYGGAPFVPAFAGTLYGLGVGLIRSSFDYKLAQPMLTWLTPIFLGFHLFHNWRDYPRYRTALQWTFMLGALVMGAYGVAQFLLAPQWDRFWMINVEYLSFGKPEPLGIRVYSTLNAPGPFAVVMMACLLVLFSAKSWLRFPAAIAGYLSFLLSMTRSAWTGWVLGMIALLAGMELKARLRLLVAAVVLVAVIVPLAMMPPFSQVVGPRLQSMAQPKNDTSLTERVKGYGKYLSEGFLDPLGKGIGVMDRVYAVAADDETIGPHDSAILELLLSLGVPGALFYGIGLIALLLSLWRRAEIRQDVFANAARAIALGMFAQLVFGSVMIGVMGVMLWGFSSIVIAARMHHAEDQQNVTAPHTDLADLL